MSDTKDKLRDMIDKLISQKPDEEAQISFHDYLQTKIPEILSTNTDQNIDEE